MRRDEPAALAPMVATRSRRRPASRPPTSAAISSRVAGAGWAAPGGRQSGQTVPPAGTENAVWRRCAAHRAFAQRRRPAGDGHRPQQVRVEHQGAGVLAAASARIAPSVSRYSRSDGSRSTGVSRSAVSAMALAAVYRG